MSDLKYCYPNSNVLINKLNIRNQLELFNVEKKITAIRLNRLQKNPIKGNFDFDHLKKIHKYIFQDLYAWAGKPRTVEIGNGNLFCTVSCLQKYADSIFRNYFYQCKNSKQDQFTFIKVLAKNYGDLYALHPFREGNGRAQREFARIVCLECGFDFSLNNVTHEKMLQASIASFNLGDNSLFEQIFYEAINIKFTTSDKLKILTKDDLEIVSTTKYDSYEKYQEIEKYNKRYQSKIDKMQNESEKSFFNSDKDNDIDDYNQ